VTAALMTEGVDVSLVRRHEGLPTGRAHITVDEGGGSTIVVVPGANLAVDFPAAALDGASVLLAQLECPLPVVVAALAAARAADVVTILDPSPALPLDSEVLSLVDYLVPNHHDARALGVDANGVATGGGTLIITRGGEGATVRKGGREKLLPPVEVPDVVDPSAAGDAFCGTLAAGLASGRPFGLVLARAAAAGAHAVTVPGALPALPTSADVDSLLAPDD
jgi:ribokinase